MIEKPNLKPQFKTLELDPIDATLEQDKKQRLKKVLQQITTAKCKYCGHEFPRYYYYHRDKMVLICPECNKTLDVKMK